MSCQETSCSSSAETVCVEMSSLGNKETDTELVIEPQSTAFGDVVNLSPPEPCAGILKNISRFCTRIMQSCMRLPFLVIISVLEIAVFLYYLIPLVQRHGWLALIISMPDNSMLIYNPLRRYQAWRFVTYMLVHAGFIHVALNVLSQLLWGIPLERQYGGWRVMLVYFAGVIAGSLSLSVSDPQKFVLGASGGVYALCACSLADSIIVSWQMKKIPWCEIFICIFIIIGDVGMTFLLHYISGGKLKLGNTAHLGGVVAGLLVGINFFDSLKNGRQGLEKLVLWFSLTVYLLLTIAAITWNVFGNQLVKGYYFPAKYDSCYGNPKYC